MKEDLQDIIPNIISGDQKAFRTLMEQFQQPAFALAFRILGHEEEAKDAVQEGFIKIWQNIRTYTPGKKFSSWMFRIISNCAIDRLRKIRRQHEVRYEEVAVTLGKFSSDDTDTKMDNREIAQLVQFLARDLPEKQQLVFILRDIQGMESIEVQEILGLSENTVKSNLHHGRKTIRQKIERMFYQERRES